MTVFGPEQRDAIAQAITKAESNTRGEIVVVLARASGGYYAYALMWVALIALLVPWPLIYATKWPVQYIYLLQLAVFAVGALLIQWERLRLLLVPKAVKRTRAHRRAVEQFLVQNLHTTKGRTGVLIYVSLAEHFAEVIADDGIYQKVAASTWERVVDELTTHIGRGAPHQGFIAAIDACGKLLAEHFPPGKADSDELPNHLIVLDGP